MNGACLVQLKKGQETMKAGAYPAVEQKYGLVRQHYGGHPRAPSEACEGRLQRPWGDGSATTVANVNERDFAERTYQRLLM